MSRISVVIRCLNEEKHIGRLLTGIEQQTLSDVEIVVVDSGSTDATLSIVKHFPTKVVHIRAEDFSFGRSLNLGCAEASGELIAIASAHVYPVYRDWLERLIAPFDDDRVGLVYGRQRGDETTRFSERQVFRRWFPKRSNGDQDTPFCNNANAAVRRSLWERQRYDETLTGLEDLDWAKRIKAAGHRIAYAADAEIVHVHEESPRQIYNRYRREAMALKRIFPEERFGLSELLRLLPANVTSDCRQALRDGGALGNLPDIVLFRTMQFLGTYRGFRQGRITSGLKQTFYYPQRTSERADAGRDDERRIDYSRASPPG